MELLNTLYVTTPGVWLHLERENLCVTQEQRQILRVPLHHLQAVVVVGESTLSHALIGRCAKDGRSIVHLDRSGRFLARIEGPVQGNVLLRKAQHDTLNSATKCLSVARSFVAGKLSNSRKMLQRGVRDGKDETGVLTSRVEELRELLRKVRVCTSLDELRGLEGEGARLWFQSFSLLVSPELRDVFGWQGRNRRPPRDRVNALLSFLYTLLLGECRSALESVGLDPQVGYLHCLRPGRMALALDLMEEFRPAIADRLFLALVNRRQIAASAFQERDGGSVLLTDDGRRAVITAWQTRKQEQVEHRLLKRQLPLGLLPHVQARLLARALREGKPYLPYLQR